MSRIVVVTGAAGGMGQAIVRTLSDAGMRVAGFDRIESPHAALSVVADVSSSRSVANGFALVEQQLGEIDAVISAAGHYESIPFTDITDEQVARMLRVHLGGFVACTRAVLPGMLQRGSGSIVAVASELAIGGGDRDSHYAAAKGALIGVVRSLATEVADQGVRVNAIAPGPTNTPLLAADSPWRAPEYLATLPTKALAEPEEVAICAEYLITQAGFMTGEVLNLNSGAVI